MIFWESNATQTIAARVAIAGDFLPAGRLSGGNAIPPAWSGWREMAASLENHFDDVVASFVNCESPLHVDGLAPRPLNGLGDIVSAPVECLDYLHAIRAKVVGIANNHAYDFGAPGVSRTRSAISQQGMIPLGAGQELRSPPETFVWQGPGQICVGFWAAARATSDAAWAKTPGVEPATRRRAQQALEAMKRQGARFCIALFHAGCLRTHYPDPEDLELLDDIARIGFDLVAASHSHLISGAKIIPGGIQCDENHPAFCFYGLGSLVSGFVASPAEREGLVVVACFGADGSLARMEVRPVWLADNGFGEIPSSEASHAILVRFRKLSEQIADGSNAHLFYRDVSRGLFHLYARDVRQAFEQAGLRGLSRKAQRIRARHVRRLVHKVFG